MDWVDWVLFLAVVGLAGISAGIYIHGALLQWRLWEADLKRFKS